MGSPDQSITTIAGINIWRHMGYMALLFLAGLQSIPKDVYEAAAIDGASEVRSFWYITLPLLRPVLVFVLVTTIIGAFQIFDTIAVTTEGGPIDSTRVIMWYIYEYAFQRFNMGYTTTHFHGAVCPIDLHYFAAVALVPGRRIRPVNHRSEYPFGEGERGCMSVQSEAVGQSRFRRPNVGRVIAWIILGLLIILILFPFWWIIRTSLSDPKQLFVDTTSLLPTRFTLNNYARVLGLMSTSEAVAAGRSGQRSTFFFSCATR